MGRPKGACKTFIRLSPEIFPRAAVEYKHSVNCWAITFLSHFLLPPHSQVYTPRQRRRKKFINCDERILISRLRVRAGLSVNEPVASLSLPLGEEKLLPDDEDAPPSQRRKRKPLMALLRLGCFTRARGGN